MDVSHHTLLSVFVIPGSHGNTTDINSKYFFSYFVNLKLLLNSIIKVSIAAQ